MAAVKWDDVSGYIEQVFNATGLIQYNDIMAVVFADNANDDIVDALDAIGSRVFSSPSAVRDFLIEQGYILSE